MEKYEIKRKSIQKVELVSLTSQNWYDSEHNLIPWSGTSGTYYGPKVNDIVYNVSGSTPTGYYKWLGLSWSGITKTDAYEDFNIPLFLENTIDELGVMVGFNGEMEQVEQLCNFTYSGITNSYTLTISNSVNPDKLRTIVEQNFTINWGDGTTGTIGSTEFSQVSHTYPTITSGKTYEVSIYLESPWTAQKLTKSIRLPIKNTSTINNEFGNFTGYTITNDYFSQNYINNLDYTTSGTTYPPSYTGFTYAAIGGSRLDEKKLYGSTTYSGTTIEYDSNLEQYYTGYTINGFYYRDYPDGYTMITGSTKGTTDIPKEEVPNYCITRNEHFLGFVDEPTIYSDIFVERGKQGVMEKNLRLSEIDNIGELEIYGNGYFNIKKQ